NSYGYFWGMVGGILAAMIVPAAIPQLTVIYTFPIILLLSIVGCIAGSLMTRPDDEEVLKNFYVKVRPWGFWSPIREKVQIERPELVPNRDASRDMFNVVVGIIWQTALTATGIYLVLEEWFYLSICVAVVLVTSTILKFNWYDRLRDYPEDHVPADDGRAASAKPALA
ncbi:MAG: sodium:solute symporter, partial [Rhodothermales bacterium]